jgi:hypothetical protein
MLLLGHLGIGRSLVETWKKNLPALSIYAGTLFPDLLDKGLYYSLSWVTGKTGSDLGLISCTRTLGHTALFLFLMSAISFHLKRTQHSKQNLAIAFTAGIATHQLLDLFSDAVLIGFIAHTPKPEPAAWVAFFYPAYLPRFSVATFANLGEHLNHAMHPFSLSFEALGALLLIRQCFLKTK